MRLPLLTLSLLFGLTAQATSLLCEYGLNNSLIASRAVITKPMVKSEILNTEGGSASVTERSDGLYELEAYLPQYDARIYAEGRLLSPTDKVKASLWGRELLVDLQCQLKPVN